MAEKIKALCSHCGEPFNESQYRQDGKYKSCPKCSSNGGGEHIYYLYPAAFGITEKRSSTRFPDGPQSYCTNCRGNATGPYPDKVTCSSL